MKNKETLEEAAENAFNDFKSKNLIVPQKHILPFKLGHIEGAKWQKEQDNKLYSEEEVLQILQQFELAQTEFTNFLDYVNKNACLPIDSTKWFENYKKK